MADSIAAFQAARDAGDTSSVALVTAALDAIARDAHLNAWCALAEPAALLELAAASDARHAAGQLLGPLDGVTFGVKDNICVTGLPCTAASAILAGFIPPYDAEVVTRLRAAGAIILGKNNMDEFGMGSSSERSAHGPVGNPAAPGHVPGGSSGGSAAAVAAGHCLAALGSDTGGSIRQPASHCGVVGLKPTYGRVSRRGLIAYASSLDQIGPICRTAADAALVLSVIAGHDPLDATSLDLDADLPAPRATRIGVPRALFDDPALDPDVRASTLAALDALVAQGASLHDVQLPHLHHALAAYYLIATAEASSNLSRYDGVRYGHRAADPTSLPDLYERSRAEGFGLEVKRRVLLGTFVLSAGYYDAYYLKAQRVRTLICRAFEDALAGVDVIAAPVAPQPAFPNGARSADPLQMILEDLYTVPVNLAGLPAISIPCAPAPDGRPIGLQLIARPLHEATLTAMTHGADDVHG
jgi:aspartyl-tRNA(Asn)/glutamyl-tRNA(Gln) amidotransferase subunit A